MKLHSPAFERAVRRKVKSAIRAEPALKRETARNRARKMHSIALPARAAVTALLGLLVWSVGTDADFQAKLALITLWAGAFVSIEAGNLAACLYSSPNLPPLTLLPIRETEIFRWQLQAFFRKSLWFLLDVVVAYQSLALQSRGTIVAGAAAMIAAVFTWAVVIALACKLAVRWPRLPYQLPIVILFIFSLIEFVGREIVWAPTLELARRFGPAINILLPTGWPATLLAVACGKTHWLFLLLLAPATLLLAGTRSAIERLRSGYRFQEPAAHTAFAESADGELEGGASVSAMANALASERAIQLEDNVRRQLRAPAPPRNAAGRLENFLWGWLNDRQKILAEFAFPFGVSLTSRWYVVFRNVAVTLVAAGICSRFSPTAARLLLPLGAFITASHVLHINLAAGGIFQSRFTSGVQIPLFLAYPVTPRELGAFFMKVAAVQWPYTMAFTLVWGVVAAIFLEFPIRFGLLIAFKAAGLVVFSRFIFLAMSLSSLSDDSRHLKLRSLIVLGFIIGFGLAFVGCGAASLLVPFPLVAWLCWVLSAIASWMFFKTYTWFYNRNWFDLISVPGR